MKNAAAKCEDTYKDALAWDDARLDREQAALCSFMTINWGSLTYEGQEVLVREHRALSRARAVRQNADMWEDERRRIA